MTEEIKVCENCGVEAIEEEFDICERCDTLITLSAKYSDWKQLENDYEDLDRQIQELMDAQAELDYQMGNLGTEIEEFIEDEEISEEEAEQARKDNDITEW